VVHDNRFIEALLAVIDRLAEIVADHVIQRNIASKLVSVPDRSRVQENENVGIHLLVFLDGSLGLPEIQSENCQSAIAILDGKGLEYRQLFAACRSPVLPEEDQNHLSLEIREAVGIPIRILEGEIRCGAAHGNLGGSQGSQA
jgi:hypothetical protein